MPVDRGIPPVSSPRDIRAVIARVALRRCPWRADRAMMRESMRTADEL